MLETTGASKLKNAVVAVPSNDATDETADLCCSAVMEARVQWRDVSVVQVAVRQARPSKLTVAVTDSTPKLRPWSRFGVEIVRARLNE